MSQAPEKRNFTRHHSKGQITLLQPNANTQQTEGELINYSEQGIRFFSHRPVRPGTTVIVRVSGEHYRNLPADSDCQLRSMGFCTVKWCQEGTHQGQPIHEMGAVYVMPY